MCVSAGELIAQVTEWAERDDRVLAAAVSGSHARGEVRPDSDIDFCILTADPVYLLNDRRWIYELGSDARIAGPVEDYKLVQSIRVFYGVTEAEFGVTDEAWAELPIDDETAGVINDGLRILYDPEGRLEKAVAYASLNHSSRVIRKFTPPS
ncbi:MAG: nucleotidyltransferase domain-containing protein [Woeseiaceae bacterium]|nr:nucleotidyltransferase domain-containing protein [Woeseiaceae bacterium]